MKIKTISVDGLFGIFQHQIPLNTDERITIIHGPNGFGKTAILRMLNGLFNAQYSRLRSIPFNRLKIEFDNHTRLEVVKTSHGKTKEHKGKISLDFYSKNSKKQTHDLKHSQEPPELNFPISALDDIIPGLERIAPSEWLYLPTGETLSLRELIERFEDILPFSIQTQSHLEPQWFKDLKQEIHIRLIESQRLLNFSFSPSSRVYPRIPSMLHTVSAYSEETAKLIQSKLALYGTISQSLDRTFPVRLVQQQPCPKLTDEQLRQKLEDLEKKHTRLIDIGLLENDENANLQIQPPTMD
ncbi:AAA family ATPase [Spirulina subsalsa]|uniref:AAA family ATPase n=1 Tax=Spirulina subsalsa TaxID=54311 RepID=UPI000309FB04|nr:AAA family ATPase [Spirulina subsalsa]